MVFPTTMEATNNGEEETRNSVQRRDGFDYEEEAEDCMLGGDK